MEERLCDASGGGDRRPGQHFIGGKEPATMALHFVDRGSGFGRVEMLDGIAYQVYTAAPLDQATRGVIHANLGDNTIQNDLATPAEPLQHLADVWIGENIDGLLFDDDLRIGAEIPRKVNLAVRDHIMISQNCPRDFFLPRSSSQTMRRIIAEFRVAFEVRVGGGDNRDPALGGEVSQAAYIVNNLFCPRHVELALGMHEVHLRIDIPKKKVRHSFGSIPLDAC